MSKECVGAIQLLTNWCQVDIDPGEFGRQNRPDTLDGVRQSQKHTDSRYSNNEQAGFMSLLFIKLRRASFFGDNVLFFKISFPKFCRRHMFVLFSLFHFLCFLLLFWSLTANMFIPFMKITNYWILFKSHFTLLCPIIP